MNLCTLCDKDFGSVESFDSHRIGEYPQTGPSAYNGKIEDYMGYGRRCLTTDEMEQGTERDRQFSQDARGRWSLTHRLERTRRHFRQNAEPKP